MGCFGIIILYFSDTLHYGLSLSVINFDIWLVVLAAISSSKIYLDGKSMVDSSGNSNKGILIGDYKIKKREKGQSMTRDSFIRVPKKNSNSNGAL